MQQIELTEEQRIVETFLNTPIYIQGNFTGYYIYEREYGTSSKNFNSLVEAKEYIQRTTGPQANKNKQVTEQREPVKDLDCKNHLSEAILNYDWKEHFSEAILNYDWEEQLRNIPSGSELCQQANEIVQECMRSIAQETVEVYLGHTIYKDDKSYYFFSDDSRYSYPRLEDCYKAINKDYNFVVNAYQVQPVIEPVRLTRDKSGVLYTEYYSGYFCKFMQREVTCVDKFALANAEINQQYSRLLTIENELAKVDNLKKEHAQLIGEFCKNQLTVEQVEELLNK